MPLLMTHCPHLECLGRQEATPMPLNGEEKMSNCLLPLLPSCLPHPQSYGSTLAKKGLNLEGQGGWSLGPDSPQCW